MVVVPKKGGKWCICVDYYDINETCPKDSFPLPRIDKIMDAIAGHGILSFLDAFSRYHHIPMHPPDAKKMTFITPPQIVLLQCNVVWFEKCRGNLSKDGDQDILILDR